MTTSARFLTLTRFDSLRAAVAALPFVFLLGCGADQDHTAANRESDALKSVLLISDIQGSGDASPVVSQRVQLSAVVVGDFQSGELGEQGNLGGFFVQSASGDEDRDSDSSEGLFIADGDAPATDVVVGDRVWILGHVSENSGLTTLTADQVEVLERDVALPPAVQLKLPVKNTASLEALEGMRVRIPQSLIITDHYNFDRYGELALALPQAGEPRLYQPTSLHSPGSKAQKARAAQNRSRQILLDDGRNAQNPDPARHPNGSAFALDNRFRAGDQVTDVAGVLSFAAGRYRIQPTEPASYRAQNLRDEVPDVGGDIRVAAFNVLNYFTTLDERGARDSEEFRRQRAKIFAALAEIDADIVGLIEIENNAGAALDDLVQGLNAHIGRDDYRAVRTGNIGSDAITVALIYKPATVRLQGAFAVLDGSVDDRFLDTKNRPSLAQTFVDDDGNDITVVVNHLKSKGSDCDDLGDPNRRDGAGNCNGTREAAAKALAEWALSDPTGTADDDVLLIGDLNTYREETPVDALIKAGFTDLLAQFVGDLAYTYVYAGQVGYLDHALASPSLMASGGVTGAAVWHINADEPDLLDYTTRFKRPAQDALYSPDPYRSSDHDPVLIGIDLHRVSE
ncbi:MAG: ExeM/NucH family extracellular endonuclease [Halieaceae bacterium]|nr:ExeM/NucH family extracellular endonuclease [Halieaceae bacterium]